MLAEISVTVVSAEHLDRYRLRMKFLVQNLKFVVGNRVAVIYNRTVRADREFHRLGKSVAVRSRLLGHDVRPDRKPVKVNGTEVRKPGNIRRLSAEPACGRRVLGMNRNFRKINVAVFRNDLQLRTGNRFSFFINLAERYVRFRVRHGNGLIIQFGTVVGNRAVPCNIEINRLRRKISCRSAQLAQAIRTGRKIHECDRLTDGSKLKHR